MHLWPFNHIYLQFVLVEAIDDTLIFFFHSIVLHALYSHTMEITQNDCWKYSPFKQRGNSIHFMPLSPCLSLRMLSLSFSWNIKGPWRPSLVSVGEQTCLYHSGSRKKASSSVKGSLSGICCNALSLTLFLSLTDSPHFLETFTSSIHLITCSSLVANAKNQSSLLNPTFFCKRSGSTWENAAPTLLMSQISINYVIEKWK